MGSSPRSRSRRGSLIVHVDEGIVVRRDPDRSTGRLVILDGMEASYVDIADPAHLEFSYLRWIRDAIDGSFSPRAALEVVHLGGAGCALARHLTATRRHVRNEVFECDPRVADMARRVLGVQNTGRLRLRITDARRAVAARPDASADVVVGDAFVDGLVPAHLSTIEFAQEVARVLAPGGLYAVNVVDAPPLRISRRMAAGLLAVFPAVALIVPPRVLRGRTLGNLVFVCSAEPVPLEQVRVRAARDGEPVQILDHDGVTFFAAGARPLHDGDAPAPAQ